MGLGSVSPRRVSCWHILLLPAVSRSFISLLVMYAVFIWFVSSLLFGLVWLQRFLFVFFKAPAFDFIDFSIFAIAGFLETGGSWAPDPSVPTSQVSQAQVSTPRASVCISVFVGLCASSFSFCSVFTLLFFSSLNWNPIQDISSQHYHLNATSQTVWMLGMEVWSSEGLRTSIPRLSLYCVIFVLFSLQVSLPVNSALVVRLH